MTPPASLVSSPNFRRRSGIILPVSSMTSACATDRQRFAEYRQAALAAQRRFGVDAAAVVAVWGVESDFGKSYGTRPVIQSLTTLACTPNRRSDYFRGELIAALKIVDKGDVKLGRFQRLVGGRLRQHAIHAFDLSEPRRRHGWRRPARRRQLGSRRPRLDRQFPASRRLGHRPSLGIRSQVASQLSRSLGPRRQTASGESGPDAA